MDSALQISRAARGGGAAIANHAESPNVHADGRHSRRSDHFPSRTAGRTAKLGLPDLLAAGCDFYATGVDSRGISQGGEALAGLAGAIGSRQPGANSSDVWTRWRTSLAGMGSAMASRLQECAAGSGGKCCQHAIAARHLWGALGCAAPDA